MRRLLSDGRGQATRNGRPAGSRRRGTERLTYRLSQRRQRKRQGRVTDAPAHMPATVPMNGRVGDHLAADDRRLRTNEPVEPVEPARGRPPQAAARRAGLEGEERFLTATLTSTDMTEWDAGM